MGLAGKWQTVVAGLEIVRIFKSGTVLGAIASHSRRHKRGAREVHTGACSGFKNSFPGGAAFIDLLPTGIGTDNNRQVHLGHVIKTNVLNLTRQRCGYVQRVLLWYWLWRADLRHRNVILERYDERFIP
ncbi:MAG: hypothetical protein OKBPIBMD_02195 [Chlorobi bacterium]|nr:hypothetical protein [Chlorobiota bacterium]